MSCDCIYVCTLHLFWCIFEYVCGPLHVYVCLSLCVYISVFLYVYVSEYVFVSF